METLVLHDVPPDLHEALSERASLSGRTIEAEALDALKVSLVSSEPISPAPETNQAIERLQATMHEAHGVSPDRVEAFIAERRKEAEREYEEDLARVIRRQPSPLEGPQDLDQRQKQSLERVRSRLRAYHGGAMPGNAVDQFLAERRAEAEREHHEGSGRFGPSGGLVR